MWYVRYIYTHSFIHSSTHVIRNILCWDASYTGTSKQRNSYQFSMTFLCLKVLLCNLRPSIINSVPCGRIVQRARCICKRLVDVQDFSEALKDYKPHSPSPASSVLHGWKGTLKNNILTSVCFGSCRVDSFYHCRLCGLSVVITFPSNLYCAI